MRQPILFGKYLLLERISVGGMAEVFKAKYFGEEGFEKILAIKRILPSMAEDEQFITMFIDEAKIAGELSHPNIGQIFELGKIEGAHFIAMEYVWGKDVLQIQNRCRRLRQKIPLHMAAFIASRVCEGLDYAHRKTDVTGKPMHIIHRDVSPQNILVSYTGEVKIIDFGIAKARSRSSKTQAGVLKGKFGYMSPEQVRGLPLDQRSDIFSIGTLLYEMVTGERLFTGETDFATLEKVRNADVIPPSQVNPAVPPELDAIILRALKRNADQRFQWASEMCDELQAFLHTGTPIYSPKMLSYTVTQMFEAERQREVARFEEYKGLNREAMAQFSTAPIEEKKEVVMSLLSLDGADQVEPLVPELAEELTEGLGDGEADEMPGEATVVGGPAFLQEQFPALGPDPAPMPRDLDELSGDEEHATRVFAADGGREPSHPRVPDLAGEPTYVFATDNTAGVPINDHATMLFNKPGPGGMALEEEPNQGPTVLFDVSASTPFAPRQTGRPVPPPVSEPVSGTMPVQIETRQPSMVKDILIGVLVALVVIMGVVVWRMFSSGGFQIRHPATLVITATPAQVAEVLVDGQAKGKMIPGTPFTLKEVSAKEHLITLRRQGFPDVKQVVALEAGDVKVVNIPLAGVALPKDTRGLLALRVDPVGARVELDGKPVVVGAGAAPLLLASGTRHTFVVRKEGYQDKSLTVELKPGERAEQIVTLERASAPDAAPAALASLKVVSTPAGAEVELGGQMRGKTPLTLEGLQPGQAQVRLHLAGHLPRSEGVTLQSGKQALLESSLQPDKPVAVAAAPAPQPVAVAARPTNPAPAASPTPKTSTPSASPRPAAAASSSSASAAAASTSKTTSKKPAAPSAPAPPEPAAPVVVRGSGDSDSGGKTASSGTKKGTTILVAANDPSDAPPASPKEPKATTGKSTRKGSGSSSSAGPAGDSPGPKASSGAEGYLVASTTPWASVIIDGKDTGKSTPILPRAKLPLKPGSHMVTFVVNGKKFDFPVVVTSGEITRLIKTLPVE